MAVLELPLLGLDAGEGRRLDVGQSAYHPGRKGLERDEALVLGVQGVVAVALEPDRPPRYGRCARVECSLRGRRAGRDDRRNDLDGLVAIPYGGWCCVLVDLDLPIGGCHDVADTEFRHQRSELLDFGDGGAVLGTTLTTSRDEIRENPQHHAEQDGRDTGSDTDLDHLGRTVQLLLLPSRLNGPVDVEPPARSG